MADRTDKDNGDYLGYGVYAQTLWNRIEAALNKDQGNLDKLGDDPLVVGIFGEWGSGKSTLLKLVERCAAETAKQADQTHSNILTVPVYFQPWKYEHERHLLVPLVLHVVEATRAALKDSPTVRQKLVLLSKDAQVSTWKWGKRVHESAKVARKWFPVLKKIVGSLSVFGVSIALPEEIDDWLEDAETVFASPEAKEEQRVASVQEARHKKLSFVDNGFHYYELHELLKSLTRPEKGVRAKDSQQSADADLLRLNFVIFIDDLDRCLPEKAVETLELIKTVFNLESFAFVLALDEEVVERGIGHRYKDYALQNKKPEMPITGFEYLEKIVHLPFRLPGLTKEQARHFLQRYEKYEVASKTPERWWFAQRSVSGSGSESVVHETLVSHPGQESRGAASELTDLVLNSFTSYVPRKLVRLVELLHQVQEIALRQGKVMTVGRSSGPDVRVVTALVMLQLFQPNLYRLVRRRPQAFPMLLAAFAARKSGYRDFSDPEISDVDLWLWVVDESVGDGNDWIQSSDVSKAIDAVVARMAKRYHVITDHGEPVRYKDRNEDGEEVTATEYDVVKTREKRSRAQNVKLPLVIQIVEHRATQRHVFDPLRLFHALAGALESDWDANQSDSVSPASEVTISDYFELLVAAEGADTLAATFTGPSLVQESPPTQPVRYPDRLLAEITSDQPEVQANLLANNELEAGKFLELDAAEQLLSGLKEWKVARANDEDTLNRAKERLARGLRVIAPFVPRELGADFLGLVDDVHRSPFSLQGDGKTFKTVEDVRSADARAELWSALGQDDRFTSTKHYLPRTRFLGNEHDLSREPIPGFVRVIQPEGERFQFVKGREVTLHAFYIARYLTTVDQYACFVRDGGYGVLDKEKPVWWDSLGWAWRTGVWDSQFKRGIFGSRQMWRKPELRHEPMSWAEQQAHGSRPVVSVNWFEARAYANWLNMKLQADLEALPMGYAVRLPTEAQWARAARAKDPFSADERQFPWGGQDEKTANLHANLSASHIGRPSPVGLFAPSALGLCDLSGNVWEWQNNLYTSDDSLLEQVSVTDVAQMKSFDDIEPSDRLGLRGGGWSSSAAEARTTIRNGDRPDLWNAVVGFRLALSLANSALEP